MRSTSEIVTSLWERRDAGTPPTDMLCRDCVEDLALTGAGLSLVDGGGLRTTLGASDPDALRLERLQIDLGEGPCIDASRTNLPSMSASIDGSAIDRWPIFAPLALEAGMQAAFALPLAVREVGLGALGLYRSSPGPLGDRSTLAAEAYAEAAVDLCLGLQSRASGEDGLHELMDASLEHQAEVHQASGFVSVTGSLSPQEALLLLRAHAFATDRPLVDVARDVLSGRLRIPSDGHRDE